MAPILSGWSFEPPVRSYAALGSDRSDQNFVGTQIAFSISGYVIAGFGGPVEGVVLALTGAVDMSDTTDVAGYYEFTGLPKGSYEVEPHAAGAYFSPVSRAYETLGRDLRTENFVARARAGDVQVVGGKNGYVEPDKGEVASIVILPRISGTVNIVIYTLRGEIVLEERKQVEPDTESIFEWGCKNDAGDIVSPGVYVVVVGGAGLQKTAKIAVIR